MAQWDPTSGKTAVDVQLGGPGNPYKILDIDGEIDAPSGGGYSVESRWGRSKNGGEKYRGSRRTGNRERVTAQVMTRLKSEKFLTEKAELADCQISIRVRQRCGNVYNLVDYTEIIELFDAAVTSNGYSGSLAVAKTNSDDDISSQYSVSAGLEQRYQKLRHDDISKSVNDIAFNKTRFVGQKNCPGRCGPYNPGNLEWIAVTDQDSTPGYSSNASPLFFWTVDGGNTWDSVYTDPVSNENALDVVLAGEYIVVALPTTGAAYARYRDIKDGVANPWTVSTGFSGNGMNALALLNGTTILGAGNGGRIWISTDAGLSFTSVDAGATTSQNLNSVASEDETLAWIGGNSGVLLKYSNGIVSPVIVQDSTGTVLTANINVVAVAEERTFEVLLGTAGGEIHRSTNALATKPIFTDMTFDKHGNGSIDDLQFAGPFGSVLFVVQSDANANSRVLRDMSGGALGVNVEIVGGFSVPGNNGINSIAPADPNTALCVGEVDGSFAYIGKLVGGGLPTS